MLLLVEGTILSIFLVDMLSLISVNSGSPATVINPSYGPSISNFMYVIIGIAGVFVPFYIIIGKESKSLTSSERLK